MPHRLTDPEERDRILGLQNRLEEGLAAADPHHRLYGRPVSYHVIAGQTLEIIYQEVVRIDQAEIDAVRRLIGEPCYWSVTPRGRETLTVRFVVRLARSTEGSR